MIGGRGVICIGWLHFDLRNLNRQSRTRFRNLLIWLAPGSLMHIFLGFFPMWLVSLVFYETFLRETGLIGRIRQGFARVGLEACQPDRDRVSSDQGFLIGRSGCDRSDQGQLRRVRLGEQTAKESSHKFLPQVFLRFLLVPLRLPKATTAPHAFPGNMRLTILQQQGLANDGTHLR